MGFKVYRKFSQKSAIPALSSVASVVTVLPLALSRRILIIDLETASWIVLCEGPCKSGLVNLDRNVWPFSVVNRRSLVDLSFVNHFVNMESTNVIYSIKVPNAFVKLKAPLSNDQQSYLQRTLRLEIIAWTQLARYFRIFPLVPSSNPG